MYKKKGKEGKARQDRGRNGKGKRREGRKEGNAIRNENGEKLNGRSRKHGKKNDIDWITFKTRERP